MSHESPEQPAQPAQPATSAQQPTRKRSRRAQPFRSLLALPAPALRAPVRLLPPPAPFAPSGDENAEAEDATPELLRQRLVALLREKGITHDAAVERALLTVPRHLFLPETPLADAYADIAVATHWEDGQAVSSASQPAIVALMLEQLQLAQGMRVLEIGAGTGYNAALLTELVGPTGQVTTIDIDPEIAAEASANLLSAGYTETHVIAGDGAIGWPKNAPYDRIELSVGASDIAPAWFDQLAEGGIITLPLWLGASDVSVAFRKRGGALVSESLTPCGFMRLRGQEADADKWAKLPTYGLLAGARAHEIAETVARLLAARPRRRLMRHPDANAIQALALRHAGFVTLWTERPSSGKARRRLRMRNGLYAEGEDGPSLALFGSLFPVLLVFGGEAAERTLLDEATSMRTHPPMPVEQWRVIAHPQPYDEAPPPGAVRLERRHFVYDVLAN